MPSLTAMANDNDVVVFQPTGSMFVQDPENYLSATTVQKLERRAERLYEETTAQVGFLIIHSLQGYTIEEVAFEAFNTYGLGTKEANNGVLVVLAIEDRQVRIEVGLGLENWLTDYKAEIIIEEYMIDHLSQGNYSQGLLSAMDILYDEITAGYHNEASGLLVSSVNEEESIKLNFSDIFKFIVFATVAFLLIFFRRGDDNDFDDKSGPWGGGGSSNYSSFNDYSSSGDSSGGSSTSDGGGSSGGGGASGSW